MLDALFADSPHPLYVLDGTLRLMGFNEAAGDFAVLPLGGALGQPLRHWAAGLHQEPVEAMLHEVLATGEPRRDLEVAGGATPDAPDRVLALSAFRLRDADGGLPGVALSVVDATERHRAQVRLSMLREANARIGTSLDTVRTAQELADIGVPDLADTIVVDVLDAVLRGDVPAVESLGRDLLLRSAGFRSVRAADGHRAEEVGSVMEPGLTSQYEEVLTGGRPVLITEHDTVPAGHGGQEVAQANGAYSRMAVPLAARGGVLGLARFYRDRGTAPF
ncbi:PAS domain-containing protein, partial [Streptomyces sp. SID1328]|uniref:PAS domain-containing protein n=1 Tax=Streptomyces sp. SID1328 TaxID=2690250 RepID=UPI0013706148|nr:PAS domain-containing protein [Streptomyces sp. SID1328]